MTVARVRPRTLLRRDGRAGRGSEQYCIPLCPSQSVGCWARPCVLGWVRTQKRAWMCRRSARLSLNYCSGADGDGPRKTKRRSGVRAAWLPGDTPLRPGRRRCSVRRRETKRSCPKRSRCPSPRRRGEAETARGAATVGVHRLDQPENHVGYDCGRRRRRGEGKGLLLPPTAGRTIKRRCQCSGRE